MMRSSFMVGCVVFAAACSSSAPPAPPQPPPPPPAPKPAPEPEAETASAEEKKVEPLPPPSVIDVARPAPPSQLAAAHEALIAEDWQKVVEAIDGAKREIRRAPLDVRVHANAMAARAHLALGEDAKAKASYRKAVASFAGADKKLERRLGAEEGADVEGRLAAMNQSFGEALFFLAEDRRKKLDDLTPPPYEGPPDARRVKRYFERRVDLWTKRWQQAMDKAMREYEKIERLDPAPQIWLAGAAARKAQMLDEQHAVLEALEAPAGWQEAVQAAEDEAGATTPAAAEGEEPAEGKPAAEGGGEAKPAEGKPAAEGADEVKAAGGSAGAAEPAEPPPEKAALEAFQTQREQLLETLAERTQDAFARCEERAGGADSVFGRYCLAWLGKPVPEGPPPEPEPMPAPEPEPAEEGDGQGGDAGQGKGKGVAAKPSPNKPAPEKAPAPKGP